MAGYTSIPSVVNTLKTLHIWSNFNFSYMRNLYRDKQDIVDELFCKYIKPLLKYIDNPALNKERKKNIDAAAYDKLKFK